MSNNSIYRRYKPAIDAESNDDSSCYWFVFAGARLLLKIESEKAAIPSAPTPETLELSPIRSQYLGSLDGHHCYSAEVPIDTAPPTGMVFTELRASYDLIDEDMYLLAGRALQIVSWDQTNQYCGRCGHKTEPLKGERAKKCPDCGFMSYPRLSPAVITAILKDDSILLARRGGVRGRMFSVLAGFVEPGETLEECLKREVFEEVGLRVRNIKYFSSQPWPFPNSLMIGFTAEYESGEITADGSEISEAHWFHASNLPEIPPKMTIARELIDWFVERVSART